MPFLKPLRSYTTFIRRGNNVYELLASRLITVKKTSLKALTDLSEKWNFPSRYFQFNLISASRSFRDASRSNSVNKTFANRKTRMNVKYSLFRLLKICTNQYLKEIVWKYSVKRWTLDDTILIKNVLNCKKKLYEERHTSLIFLKMLPRSKETIQTNS